MPDWTSYLDPAAPEGRFLLWSEVRTITGLSRTTAWRMQKAGDFPKPYAISPGRVGYREREIDAWRASRTHAHSRAAARSVRASRQGGDDLPGDAPTAELKAGVWSPGAAPGAARPPTPRPEARQGKAAAQIKFDF